MTAPQQSRHRRPKGKTAVALPGDTTAFQDQQNTDYSRVELDAPHPKIVRALEAMLTQLGLEHSTGPEDSIQIAGQLYDLRTATALARQMQRRPM